MEPPAYGFIVIISVPRSSATDICGLLCGLIDGYKKFLGWAHRSVFCVGSKCGERRVDPGEFASGTERSERRLGLFEQLPSRFGFAGTLVQRRACNHRPGEVVPRANPFEYPDRLVGIILARSRLF